MEIASFTRKCKLKPPLKTISYLLSLHHLSVIHSEKSQSITQSKLLVDLENCGYSTK